MAKKTGPAIDPGAIYSVTVIKRVTVAGGVKLRPGPDDVQLVGAAVIEAGDAVEVVGKVAEEG